MGLPLYLAQTSAEFTACSSLPAHPAWMACHFSPYGTGLCNLPPTLTEDAMVILNDRIPPNRHDPAYILDQLARVKCACILLDFQRQGSEETAALTRVILEAESRPVGVTPQYGRDLSCPVFLPPIPPDVPPDTYLNPWRGREIWLEAAMDSLYYTVTEQGSTSAPLLQIPDRGTTEEALFCHYRIEAFSDRAGFAIWRTREDLDALLDAVKTFGVTKSVGLWQELAY